jgi:hypothetical protein
MFNNILIIILSEIKSIQEILTFESIVINERIIISLLIKI